MITVVGTGTGAPLPEDVAAGAALVVGGRRHLDSVRLPAGAERIVLGPLAPALDTVAEYVAGELPVLVLASGDPGFFGIVRALAERFGAERLSVRPGVSSVATAFARLGLPWDDAVVVSAHGRALRTAVHVCRAHPKVAVLTGPGAGPAELGAALTGRDRLLVVATALGDPARERVERVTPAEAASRDWGTTVSVVLCLATGPAPAAPAVPPGRARTVAPTRTADPAQTAGPAPADTPARTTIPARTTDPAPTADPVRAAGPPRTADPVRTVEPAPTTGPAQTAGPAPADTPARTTIPARTTDPAPTADPVRTVGPAQPTDPARPAHPATTDPAQANPAQPTDPVRAAGPAPTADPVRAAGPARAVAAPSAAGDGRTPGQGQVPGPEQTSGPRGGTDPFPAADRTRTPAPGRATAPQEAIRLLPAADPTRTPVRAPRAHPAVGPLRTLAGAAPGPTRWALEEAAFAHRDSMITKFEVRALALARLGPRLGDLVWDVGAGSGSVAVECARLGAAVVAVEKAADGVALIGENARAHGVEVDVVHGTAPDALAGLADDPDAVFVGGGGRELPAVIRACALRARRTVVVAMAALDRVPAAREALAAAGFRCDGVLLHSSRLAPLPGDVTRLAATNPVFLLWGVRTPVPTEGVDQ